MFAHCECARTRFGSPESVRAHASQLQEGRAQRVVALSYRGLKLSSRSVRARIATGTSRSPALVAESAQLRRALFPHDRSEQRWIALGSSLLRGGGEGGGAGGPPRTDRTTVSPSASGHFEASATRQPLQASAFRRWHALLLLGYASAARHIDSNMRVHARAESSEADIRCSGATEIPNTADYKSAHTRAARTRGSKRAARRQARVTPTRSGAGWRRSASTRNQAGSRPESMRPAENRLA